MTRFAHAALAVVALALAAPAAQGQSTTPPPPPGAAPPALPADSLAAFVKAFVAVSLVRDKAQAEMAEPRNKKPEEQERIRIKLRDDVAAALRTLGFTAARFEELTRLVSTDDATRKAFDAELARQSGTPKP